jgi:hypothetical protein
MLDTGDHTIATISPLGGSWSPDSDPPMFTATASLDGSDDGSGSDRFTLLYGAVLDCGSTEAGAVDVDL